MNFNNETDTENSTDYDQSPFWGNAIPNLSFWQKSQLSSVSSISGVRCLLKMWFTVQTKLVEGTYCNATWDHHYCWPPTPSGTTIMRNCSEVLQENHPQYASYLKGSAFRVCLSNGTWLKGNWTNYSECADSYDEFVDKSILEAEENELKEKVRYIVFIGSIASLVCLFTAISIFWCFRSIWCDRIILHTHLMAALLLRYVLLYIISEPFIFDRATNYRDTDWLCKAVLVLYLYTTLSSVNWMFIQGVHLNSKLTTNVFDKEPPFKLYYTFGWLVPIPFLGIYALLMEANHGVKCWKGYSEMREIWIVLGPILIDLVINVCFLLNILRILLTKVQSINPSTNAVELKHFKRAAKATIILTPIFGINNLLFIYNPGGAYHKTFVLLNTFFGSTQGVFVALVYCYLSSDVWSAVRRVYRRFRARRNATQSRSHHRRVDSCSTSSALNLGHQGYQFWRSGTFSTTNIINNSSGTSVLRLPTILRTGNHGFNTVVRTEHRRSNALDTKFHTFLLRHDSNPRHIDRASKRPSFSETEEGTVLVTEGNNEIPMCDFRLQDN